MTEPLRVLRVLTRANLGGPARQCAALWPHWPALGVHELVAVGRVRAGEVELRLPGPELARHAAEAACTAARGQVLLPELAAPIDAAGDLASVAALVRLGRRFRPHVVHTHAAKAGLVGALAARLLGVPVVHTYHGHVLGDYFGRLGTQGLRVVERVLGRARQHVVCVSQSCRDELVALGVADVRRCAVVPPAVAAPPATTQAQARAELGLAPSAFVVGFCGRFVPVKDPELFLRTLGRLVPLCGEPVLGACFGDGPMAAALRASGRGLPVRWLGADARFPRHVAACDVLLMTSRREGLPLAAVEALLQGVPVVGPRVPGLVDLEGPGVRLVAERDPDALAEACRAPGTVPDARRAALRATHAPAVVAARLAEIYRGVASSDGRTRPGTSPRPLAARGL